MTDIPKKRRLRNVTVTEISLVDRPANQHALISLAKRDGSVPNTARGPALVSMARQRGAAAIAKADAHAEVPASRTAAVAATLAEGRKRALNVLRCAGQTVVEVGGDLAIAKRDDDKRLIWGWASVIEKDGEVVVDRQGDTISKDALVAAAHQFIGGQRQGLVMHKDAAAMTIVESAVVTPEIAKAMGVTTNTTGWWIGAKVHDDAAWARVKSGELRSLSIAGSALWDGEA